MAFAPVRLALVAVALVVGAWLVLSLRAVQLQAEGKEVVDRARAGELSQADFKRGQSLLRRAHDFNADITPSLYEAFLLTSVGRRDEALAAGKRVVAEEPENFDGWVFMHVAAGAYGEKRRAAQALARVRALNPLAANVLRPNRRSASDRG